VAASTEVAPHQDAQTRADDIRSRLESLIDNIEALPPLVMAAWENRDDRALGYEDWAAYIDAEYGTRMLKLDAATRQRWIKSLEQVGMSQRAIAVVVNVSQPTVQRALADSDGSARQMIAKANKTSPELKLWDDLRLANNKLLHVRAAIKSGTPVTNANVQKTLETTVNLIKEILNLGAQKEA
jgi:predicted XRE-type DNA-binding protein